MTIIVPVYHGKNQSVGKLLMFVDDIDYAEEIEEITTIYFKDGTTSFDTPDSPEDIQRKINAASVMLFKFN
jgi:hypothetical protein